MNKTVFNIMIVREHTLSALRRGWLIIFFAAFFFFGSATQSTGMGGDRIWRDVQSPNDFIGKWEGSIIQDIPKDKDNIIPQSYMEITVSLEYIQNAQKVNGYMKVDLGQFLTDWANMDVIKIAKITKDDLWEIIMWEFEKFGEIEIGGEYFVTQDLSDNPDTFFSDNAGKLQIHESGKQLKILFFEALSFGLGDTVFTEIVLDKK
jgi:hypothetical protein